MLEGKNILVGVTGGIAAYKAAALVSALVKAGAGVDVLMTRNATRFIAPLTFSTLTGRQVSVDTFARVERYEVEHVSLAKKADLFVIATDVAGVYLNWGTPEQKLIRGASPRDLKIKGFASGSMGPKVTAAIEFVERTGNPAVIGSLEQIELAVEGKAGTRIAADCPEIEMWP